MGDFFQSIPVFWQGVLASIIAALILAILGYFSRLFSNQLQTSIQVRNAKKEDLKNKLISSDPAARSEASMLFMFNILKYLFFGNIFWVMPEAIGAILPVRFIYLLKFPSLLFFYYGLRWVYSYSSIESIRPPSSSKSLLITKATYGTDENNIDVTERLIEKVQNNVLIVKASNSIAGDPAPGKGKILRVEYKLDGIEFSDQFREGIIVVLPRVD